MLFNVNNHPIALWFNWLPLTDYDHLPQANCSILKEKLSTAIYKGFSPKETLMKQYNQIKSSLPSGWNTNSWKHIKGTLQLYMKWVPVRLRTEQAHFSGLTHLLRLFTATLGARLTRAVRMSWVWYLSAWNYCSSSKQTRKWQWHPRL